MVTPPVPAHQQSGSVQGRYVVDITGEPSGVHRTRTANLANLDPGTEVDVYVDRDPWNSAVGLAYFLADAVNLGVHLRIHGMPDHVDQWLLTVAVSRSSNRLTLVPDQ